MKNRKIVAAAWCAALLTMASGAFSQVNDPAYADYLLVGRFGELCPVCEAIVLCEAGDNKPPAYATIPASGSFTLYHFRERGFWSQLATVWEWFIANFTSETLAISGHLRPTDVYAVESGRWSAPATVEAHLRLNPATIDVGQKTIDRIEGRWLSGAEAQPIGACQRMPLRESVPIIAARRSEGGAS